MAYNVRVVNVRFQPIWRRCHRASHVPKADQPLTTLIADIRVACIVSGIMLSTLQKLFEPKPVPLDLVTSGGEIYGHVFENPKVGVARDLYWNVRVEFEPVQFDGDDWECSLAVEWLTWPVRRWRDLNGMGLGQVRLRDSTECSFYLYAQHHPATFRHFKLRESGPAIFEADFSAIADVHDGRGRRHFEVSGKCDLKFAGIVVVTDNLSSKPATSEDARMAVAEFLALDDLADPLSEQWRYVLEPLT